MKSKKGKRKRKSIHTPHVRGERKKESKENVKLTHCTKDNMWPGYWTISNAKVSMSFEFIL